MSSREDEKRPGGEAREDGAAEDAAAERRKRRLGILAGVAVVAVAVVAALAIVSGGGDSAPQGLGGDEQLAGQEEVDSLFAGIPQDGIALGDPEAPVTVVEFVDLQCPFCAEFSRNALPGIVRDYVEPGDVRLELRVLRFLGDDSGEAAAVAAAAGEQDLMWQFTDLFFANQGREGSGYVTEEFLRDIASGVDGLDVDQVLADARGAEAENLIARNEAAASTLGVESTPTFVGGPTDGRLRPLPIAELTTEALAEQIERIAPAGE